MTAIKTRKLHVWESPQLHPSEKQTSPVHVVFDDHEYDWWRIASNGTLEVGWILEREIEKGQPPTVEWKVFYAVSAGMYAKVQEYWHKQEVEDDRGSAVLGRARDEEAGNPHPATSDQLPTRTRFESFKEEGHPDEEPPDHGETLILPQVESDDRRTVILGTQEARIDEKTGVNVTSLHNYVNENKPTSPAAPALAFGPVAEVKQNNNGELAATRLDLMSPIRDSAR